jgi:hypothetical protein
MARAGGKAARFYKVIAGNARGPVSLNATTKSPTSGRTGDYMAKEKTIEDVMSQAMTINRRKGAALVQAGLEQLENDYNRGLVNFVAGTMNNIKNIQAQIDQAENHLQYQKDRLSAIHEGEFTITSQGRINFNEPRLNEGL